MLKIRREKADIFVGFFMFKVSSISGFYVATFLVGNNVNKQ